MTACYQTDRKEEEEEEEGRHFFLFCGAAVNMGNQTSTERERRMEAETPSWRIQEGKRETGVSRGKQGS